MYPFSSESGDAMPFTIVRDDICHVHADALVNAANEQLRMGGGVCGALFRAAGAAQMQAACDEIGHCDTGGAVATPAFALPARYVIHAVGPIWQGGTQGERAQLASCYRASLRLAAQLGCTSIAFPLISAGIYGYPLRDALDVAQAEIKNFLQMHEMQVTLVLFGSSSMELAEGLGLRVRQYIDDVYVGASVFRRREAWERASVSYGTPSYAERVEALNAPAADAPSEQYCSTCGAPIEPGDRFCVKCGRPLVPGAPAHSDAWYDEMAALTPPPMASAAPAQQDEDAFSVFGDALPAAAAPAPRGKKRIGIPHLGGKRKRVPAPLKTRLAHLDASFSQTLLTLIDERGLKDAQVYKKANLSRQHFSKMRSNPAYKPTKTTVLALAIALELPLDDTRMLLERAGFALSHADQRDVIVEFFIKEGIYDIFEINDTLFAFDQPLLG